MYIFAHAGQKKCNIFVRQKSVIVAKTSSKFPKTTLTSSSSGHISWQRLWCIGWSSVCCFYYFYCSVHSSWQTKEKKEERDTRRDQRTARGRARTELGRFY